MTSDAQSTVDAVWCIESARITGALTRMVGDGGLAEDFAQEAILAALGNWPDEGVPHEPGAWLMTVAKRRAIDHLRWTSGCCHPVLSAEAQAALALRLPGAPFFCLGGAALGRVGEGAGRNSGSGGFLEEETWARHLFDLLYPRLMGKERGENCH